MGKKSKRKTRWRSLPIGDVSSQNEEECDEELQQNGHVAARTKFRPRGGHQRFSATPVTNEKKQLFNEDEYTKITTPRQDVLFKKGYLGRRRVPPQLVSPASDTPPSYSCNGDHENGVVDDNQSETSSETVTSPHEMPPPLHLYNGYMDPHGGPIFYLNGGYDMYEPYSGVYSSFMVPAGPAFPGGGQVLTAVPCQPLPLQPLEWFNPRPDGWCLVPAPCGPTPPPPPLQRKKRYSTDSQNCSPQSSESTGPPGSPQHEEEVGELGPPELYAAPPPPAYVYPGYMFGPAVYNVNGVAVPGPPPVNGVLTELPPSNGATVIDPAAAAKRRKKKRRRKRRRGFRGEGAGTDEGSEESSSEEGLDEKDAIEEFPSNHHNGNTSPEGAMSQLSPGTSSGTDSAPASIPPGTSESCSELSTASSSHNSHDETEPLPIRPSRKHASNEQNVTEQIPPQDIVVPQNVSDQTEAEASIAVSVCEDVHVEITQSLPSAETIDTTEIQVAHEKEVNIVTETAIEQIQIPEVCVATPAIAENKNEVVNGEGSGAESIITVEVQVANCVEQPKTQESVQTEVKLPQTPEKLRKVSRKSKHLKHRQDKSSSEENIPEIRMSCATPESPSPTSERPTSSLSCRETEEIRISPIPPPRRRGRARHRPPTPCTLLTEQETLAQEISEQIITGAIVEAIRQCTIISDDTDVIENNATSEVAQATHGPITEAVTNWLHASPDPLISTESDDEEEDRRNETINKTGSKNGIVNPLPAPSNRFVDISTDGPEKRVEKISSSFVSRNNSNDMCHVRKVSFSSNASSEGCCGEWDAWEDPTTHTYTASTKKSENVFSSVKNQPASNSGKPTFDEADELPSIKYDPVTSVAKYYKLSHNPTVIKLKQQEAWLSANDVISDSGIESGDEPPSPKFNINERSLKFVRHIQGGFPETEPFPCGACCIIQ